MYCLLLEVFLIYHLPSLPAVNIHFNASSAPGTVAVLVLLGIAFLSFLSFLSFPVSGVSVHGRWY